MRFWLVKQEPEELSFAVFAARGAARWDGVRNFQARNHLRAMEVGDPVLWYATGKLKAVVGAATVARAAYPDPTAATGDWSAVDLRAGAALPQPVPLARLKSDPVLASCALLRQSRLSVVPLSAAEHARIRALGGAR
jgi:predicted RNA-binding protein with PUA-like domain